MISRWEGDRGPKGTVPDITARNEPPGRSPPSVRVYTLPYGGGHWAILVERYEEFEAHVLHTRRRWIHGK